MTDCPCCGQTLPTDGPAGLKLTRSQRRIYDIIRKAGPNGITSDVIFDRLYRDDPDGGPDTQTKIISVFICSLNKKLPKFGQKIQSGDWGGRAPRFATYTLVRLDA